MTTPDFFAPEAKQASKEIKANAERIDAAKVKRDGDKREIKLHQPQSLLRAFQEIKADAKHEDAAAVAKHNAEKREIAASETEKSNQTTSELGPDD